MTQVRFFQNFLESAHRFNVPCRQCDQFEERANLFSVRPAIKSQALNVEAVSFPQQLGHPDLFMVEGMVIDNQSPPDKRHSNVRLRVQNHLKSRRKVSEDRKSTRLNSSHSQISYAVFCLKK